eukprot:scaffold66168_cov66-Phaeocystis_antarctica.AAC.2
MAGAKTATYELTTARRLVARSSTSQFLPSVHSSCICLTSEPISSTALRGSIGAAGGTGDAAAGTGDAAAGSPSGSARDRTGARWLRSGARPNGRPAVLSAAHEAKARANSTTRIAVRARPGTSGGDQVRRTIRI